MFFIFLGLLFFLNSYAMASLTMTPVTFQDVVAIPELRYCISGFLPFKDQEKLREVSKVFAEDKSIVYGSAAVFYNYLKNNMNTNESKKGSEDFFPT